MVWLGVALTLGLAQGLGASPEDARSRFEAGDFDGALAATQSAARAEKEPARRAQWEVLSARCLLALRRQLEVEAALESALTDDPTLSVDPNEVPPSFLGTLDRLRLSLAGSVTVESEQPGGVKVDGVLVGTTPATQRLAVGKHVIAWVDASGQEAITRQIVVAPRETRSVRFETPRPAPPPPPPAEILPKKSSPPWLTPALVVHADIDFRAGAAVEAGIAVLGEYWLAELDGVAGAEAGATVRGGGRIEFLQGTLSAQLTLDGRAFFAPKFSPGIGGS